MEFFWCSKKNIKNLKKKNKSKRFLKKILYLENLDKREKNI